MRVICDDNIVGGRCELQDDMSASFFPDTMWSAGSYELIVGSGMEDLAANSLNLPFDHPIKDFQQDIPPYYSLIFTID